MDEAKLSDEMLEGVDPNIPKTKMKTQVYLHIVGRVRNLELELKQAKTVYCEDCAFRYGAEHTKEDGTYSCPLCELEQAEAERKRLLEILHGEKVYRKRGGKIMCRQCFTLGEDETHKPDCIFASPRERIENGE